MRRLRSTRLARRVRRSMLPIELAVLTVAVVALGLAAALPGPATTWTAGSVLLAGAVLLCAAAQIAVRPDAPRALSWFAKQRSRAAPRAEVREPAGLPTARR